MTILQVSRHISNPQEGTVTSAGDSFAKKEKAEEAKYFNKLQAEQLEKLKKEKEAEESEKSEEKVQWRIHFNCLKQATFYDSDVTMWSQLQTKDFRSFVFLCCQGQILLDTLTRVILAAGPSAGQSDTFSIKRCVSQFFPLALPIFMVLFLSSMFAKK